MSTSISKYILGVEFRASSATQITLQASIHLFIVALCYHFPKKIYKCVCETVMGERERHSGYKMMKNTSWSEFIDFIVCHSSVQGLRAQTILHFTIFEYFSIDFALVNPWGLKYIDNVYIVSKWIFDMNRIFFLSTSAMSRRRRSRRRLQRHKKKNLRYYEKKYYFKKQEEKNEEFKRSCVCSVYSYNVHCTVSCIQYTSTFNNNINSKTNSYANAWFNFIVRMDKVKPFEQNFGFQLNANDCRMKLLEYFSAWHVPHRFVGSLVVLSTLYVDGRQNFVQTKLFFLLHFRSFPSLRNC